MLSARPVQGFFRRLRWAADGILIAILLGIPWIRVGGEPLVLIDIPNRKFHVFGLVIFPQELYFLWLILALLALSLFFFTALAGRLWCGWACPQTVFTDVFAWVARRIQGWKGSGRPAHVPAWRRVATHGVWIALALVIGFHLVGYFRSPYQLLGECFAEGRLYPTTFAFHMSFSALAYLDFVFLKQTFCKYLCPYARFQGVLFDADTLVIGYDPRRGEPRGKLGHAAGDCVDCGLCVAVCPTGIDIRNGLQLECIACTQCIDACNDVMQKVGRPRDLIGYRSLAALEGRGAPRLLRPRVAVYGALIAAAAASFVVLLARRLPMELTVAHNTSALYARVADGRVGNAFDLHLENRAREARSFRIGIEGGPPGLELIAGVNPIPVAATSAVAARVFVIAPPGWDGAADELGEIRFVLEPVDDPARRLVRRTTLVGPGAAHAR